MQSQRPTSPSPRFSTENRWLSPSDLVVAKDMQKLMDDGSSEMGIGQYQTRDNQPGADWAQFRGEPSASSGANLVHEVSSWRAYHSLAGAHHSNSAPEVLGSTLDFENSLLPQDIEGLLGQTTFNNQLPSQEPLNSPKEYQSTTLVQNAFGHVLPEAFVYQNGFDVNTTSVSGSNEQARSVNYLEDDYGFQDRVAYIGQLGTQLPDSSFNVFDWSQYQVQNTFNNSLGMNPFPYSPTALGDMSSLVDMSNTTLMAGSAGIMTGNPVQPLPATQQMPILPVAQPPLVQATAVQRTMNGNPLPPAPQTRNHRFAWTHCRRTFNRKGDRNRHEASSNRGSRYFCHIAWCPKSLGNGNGYKRADKLTAHMWQSHGNSGYQKRA